MLQLLQNSDLSQSSLAHIHIVIALLKLLYCDKLPRCLYLTLIYYTISTVENTHKRDTIRYTTIYQKQNFENTLNEAFKKTLNHRSNQVSAHQVEMMM